MNPYTKDAELFLAQALAAIQDEISFPELVGGLTSLAFGFERVFKAILFDVNPVYVLQNDGFKNSAPLFYSKGFTHDKAHHKDVVSEKPDGDVISFRTALFRACVFSEQVAEHRGRLMSLNNIRDTIAHRPLSELDETRCRIALLGDALSILKEMHAGGHVNLNQLAGDRLSMLERIAIDYTVDVPARVEARLEHHRKLYYTRASENPTADQSLRGRYTPGRDLGYLVQCPACGNTAEVETEVDYDVMDGEAVPTGVFVSRLHCRFCDLDVSDYEELDEMKITMEELFSMMGTPWD